MQITKEAKRTYDEKENDSRIIILDFKFFASSIVDQEADCGC